MMCAFRDDNAPWYLTVGVFIVIILLYIWKSRKINAELEPDDEGNVLSDDLF
ncbi:MAG: hypothetical protein ACXQS3_04460 [Candidatus Methanofastidiosia archaeon]